MWTVRGIVAGEVCPPDLVAKSNRQEPQVELFNEYGPSEATVWAICTDFHHSADNQFPSGSPLRICGCIPGWVGRAGSLGGDRRDLYRRGGSGTRVPEAAGTDGGAVRAG